MEASNVHLIHADGGSANFSLQPGSFDPGDPLTQSYFIFDADPGKIITSAISACTTGPPKRTLAMATSEQNYE